MTAALLAAAAVLLAGRPSGRERLLARLAPAVPATPARAASIGNDRRTRALVAGFGGLGLALVWGGTGGLVVGVLAAVVAERLIAGLPSRAAQERERRLQRDLPIALDLVAACLGAGAPPALALAEVARAVPGPLGERLAVVASAAALGAPAQEAWGSWPGGLPDGLRAAGSAFTRAEATGAALGPMLEALAADLRHAARVRGEAAARRAGVLAVAPLGLCFLPAFVLLGVVPLVAGLVSGIQW